MVELGDNGTYRVPAGVNFGADTASQEVEPTAFFGLAEHVLSMVNSVLNDPGIYFDTSKGIMKAMKRFIDAQDGRIGVDYNQSFFNFSRVDDTFVAKVSPSTNDHCSFNHSSYVSNASKQMNVDQYSVVRHFLTFSIKCNALLLQEVHDVLYKLVRSSQYSEAMNLIYVTISEVTHDASRVFVGFVHEV